MCNAPWALADAEAVRTESWLLLPQFEDPSRMRGGTAKHVAGSTTTVCLDSLLWSAALRYYYEGFWAAVVLVIFTLLAFLFNGVVFAM